MFLALFSRHIEEWNYFSRCITYRKPFYKSPFLLNALGSYTLLVKHDPIFWELYMKMQSSKMTIDTIFQRTIHKEKILKVSNAKNNFLQTKYSYSKIYNTSKYHRNILKKCLTFIYSKLLSNITLLKLQKLI